MAVSACSAPVVRRGDPCEKTQCCTRAVGRSRHLRERNSTGRTCWRVYRRRRLLLPVGAVLLPACAGGRAGTGARTRSAGIRRAGTGTGPGRAGAVGRYLVLLRRVENLLPVR